jgi:hypothetical protein
VDAEDPECCTAKPLTVTQARFRSGTSTVRVHATLADGAFAGLDPRQQDLQLQIRNGDGELVCCTIGTAQWQKLFRRTYGFFDQTMTLCPPIKCLSLALPTTGQARATIIAGRVTPGSPLLAAPDHDQHWRSVRGGAGRPAVEGQSPGSVPMTRPFASSD